MNKYKVTLHVNDWYDMISAFDHISQIWKSALDFNVETDILTGHVECTEEALLVFKLKYNILTAVPYEQPAIRDTSIRLDF